MPPRAPDVSELLPVNHHRLYLEPIGPPTELVQPKHFVAEAQAVLNKAEERVKELEQRLSQSGVEEQVRKRCSLSPLRALISTTHSDIIAREELRQWHETRLLPITGGRSLGDGREIEDEEDEEEGFIPAMGGLTGIGEGGAKAKKVAEITEEAEASELKLLKSLDLSHYLRKHKLHDTNILQNILPCPPRSISLLAPSTPAAPLDNLLYTLVFHPIPTLSGRSPFASKKQVMHVLGSSTLADIRAALRVGGEGVPEFNEEEQENESDQEEEEEEAMGGSPGVRGKRSGVWAEGEKKSKKKKVQWGEERRRTGACFGIEGVLYPDGEDDVEDYADMILASLTSLPRSIPRHHRSPSTELLPVPNPLAPPFAPSSRAAELSEICNPDPNTIHPWVYPPTAGEASGAFWDDAKWRKGGTLQETRIGEVAVRVGEPYWFMHQGSAEHVWSVESVRYLHPLDPSPSSSPYPLTTYLSRLIHSKCRLCDRDPASIVTLNDELAGESPAWLCAKCFECLHGDVESARSGGVEVIRIFGE